MINAIKALFRKLKINKAKKVMRVQFGKAEELISKIPAVLEGTSPELKRSVSLKSEGMLSFMDIGSEFSEANKCFIRSFFLKTGEVQAKLKVKSHPKAEEVVQQEFAIS